MKETIQEGCCACRKQHEHSIAHDHSHEHGEHGVKNTIFKIIVSFLLAAAAFSAIQLSDIYTGWIQALLYLPAFILIGYMPFVEAIRNLFDGDLFDENLLMIIAAAGAFALGEYLEGMAVMILFQIGEVFQTIGVARSRKSIGNLMDIKPETANREVTGNPGTYEAVAPEALLLGEIVLVKPGEKVPIDGIVTEGVSTADTSALTGESLPVELEPGSAISSGSIIVGKPIKIQVTKAYKDSTVAKILELVENASERNSKSENFITKFAKIYTPAVVVCAVILALFPPLIMGEPWSDWISRALSFLVVSCPCALVISVPLSFYMGIGSASKKGILIKGSQYIDTLAKTQAAVFDKTGTLTKGKFEVTEVAPINPFSEEELLCGVAHAESYSNHPIARSIQEYFTQRTGETLDQSIVNDFEELPGKGIRACVAGKIFFVGNPEIAPNAESAKKMRKIASAHTSAVIFVTIDGEYAGYFSVSDTMKPETARGIRELKEKYNVRRIVMLTGDGEAVAHQIGSEAGIDEIHANCLPKDKVEILEAIKKQIPAGGALTFTGDGMNDAPVLASADVGIAMGGIGSDAAIEAADVVIMKDDISSVAKAIGIAKKTVATVKTNIIFSLVVKGVVLLLSALGISNMWIAVFADVGVSMIAIANALLIGKRVKC